MSSGSCVDKIRNCYAYGRRVCQDYTQWAKDNCQAYCGVCTSKYRKAHGTTCGEKNWKQSYRSGYMRTKLNWVICSMKSCIILIYYNMTGLYGRVMVTCMVTHGFFRRCRRYAHTGWSSMVVTIQELPVGEMMPKFDIL